MQYNVDMQGSILGAIAHNGPIPIQSALVLIKNNAGKYRVFLGCAEGFDERDTYQKVAAWGDELSFEYIEYLYNILKEQKNDNPRLDR